MEQELKDALLKISPRNGDVIFFDNAVVNARQLMALAQDETFPETDAVFVPVRVPTGKTLSESIFTATDEQKREWAQFAVDVKT